MGAVRQALERGRGQEAARLLLQGLSHDIAPPDTPLLKWLTRTLGKAAASKLVEAFVHFPCFYCKKGRLPCEECGGRGSLENGDPCRGCVGVGIARCEFCDGSGWVVLDYVPEGLRPVVIRNRAELALQRMRELLRRPTPPLSSEDPDKTARRSSRLLLSLDRQMGVFENVVVAVEQLPDSHEAKPGLQSLATKCIRGAAKGEDRIREVIVRRGESYRAQAMSAGKGSRKRSRAERRADFYASLVDADRTLAGTGLEHPFLHRAVSEAIRRRDAKAKTARSRKDRKR